MKQKATKVQEKSTKPKHYTGRQLPTPKSVSEIHPSEPVVVRIRFESHFTLNHFQFLQGALHQFQRGLPLGFKFLQEGTTVVALRRDMRKPPETKEQIKFLLDSLDLIPKKNERSKDINNQALEDAAVKLLRLLYGNKVN